MVTNVVAHEIDQQNREFERYFNGGKFAELAALYTEDARVLPPGSPTLQGRQEIQDFWLAAHGSGIKRVQLQTGSVEAAGDLAFEISTATLTLESGESQAVKYVVVWKRRAGGPWQLAADIWNG